MPQRMADVLAHRAQQEFIGRAAELAVLRTALDAEGPRVIHVHGIAGIGKSALLARFAADARAAGAVVVQLDCRRLEPTETGFLHALGESIGADTGIGALTQRLGALGATVVLTLDTYEVFRLMDTWLRQIFVPALTDNVRLIVFGRERPFAAWYALPGGGRFLQSMALAPLDKEVAAQLLVRLGVRDEEAARLARYTHGHPLALRLAAACEERPWLVLEPAPLQQALDELTRMFLADVGDATTRHILEGASVARRTTISLLRSLFPELPPQDAYDRLQRLPFVDAVSDGLVIHDTVREAIARSFRARDPSRYLDYERAAWHQLRTEASSAGDGELWRYTADMLFLVENPVVREAFFPSGTQQLAVEPARCQDDAGVTGIIRAHDETHAATVLLGWWRRLPETFSVVRGRDGTVVGLCCKAAAEDVATADWLHEDPVAAQWCLHLKRNPLAPGEQALFCRRWLSLAEGEAPCDVQAAIWLDLKRTYMEMRPALRRVYLSLRDLPTYAPVAQRLGFVVLAGQETVFDGMTYHSAMLDFGPGSVDGWLAELAAAELGIAPAPELLDVAARELVLDDTRVGLTPLEFELIDYLLAHAGAAVSRGELLRHIWGTTYTGNSNVVDAVVCTLRRKLGGQARRLETVSGVGYRIRHR
ncbi:winged helix-turn-helix domain-containing protein [Zobellella sp. DQSA1]|uniref:winged helix-turn-helix domain-containing protein n=1 Tax=Zobellella sp. DQSA1 TaxID=3342386 RepID=UPI0035C0DDA2